MFCFEFIHHRNTKYTEYSSLKAREILSGVCLFIQLSPDENEVHRQPEAYTSAQAVAIYRIEISTCYHLLSDPQRFCFLKLAGEVGCRLVTEQGAHEAKLAIETLNQILQQKNSELEAYNHTIVQRIIEKLGGRAGVNPISGTGNEFFFTLPATNTSPK